MTAAEQELAEYRRRYGELRPRQSGAGAWLGALLFLAVGVLGLWVLQAHGYVAVPIPMEMAATIQAVGPAALPTAVLPQSPQQEQYQAPPVQQPIQQQVQPVPQPPAAAPAVVEQPQPVAVPQPAPVEAPALPPPADPAFDASFQYQSDAANSPFIGCLPGRDCNPSYSQPTALPEPGEKGFVESFR